MNEFLTIAGLHLLALASPGPDFAIVLRQSVSAGRRAAIFTSIGIAFGITVHVSYCLLGVAVLIAQSPLVLTPFKVSAALYLGAIGVRSLFSSPSKSSEDSAPLLQERHADLAALRLGFFTNVLNPKVTLFFLALFTAVISPATPLVERFAYGVWMILATAAWFSALAWSFSGSQLRRLILQRGHLFERAMGVLLILLAVQICSAELGSTKDSMRSETRASVTAASFNKLPPPDALSD